MAEQLELFPQEEVDQDFNQTNEVSIPETQPIVDAEWCFQFFNNEPVVFAYSNEGDEPAPLVLQIQPIESEGLSFTHNGMAFRIFPRPISEESKQARAEQNESKD
jgi:hypothetical protein